MRRDKQVERLIAQVQYRGAASIRERMRRLLDHRWPARPGVRAPHTRRGDALTRWYRPAFAGLALLALAGLISMLSKSGGPAYALEQTVQAVKNIRYFHFRYVTDAETPEKEAWIEYDPNGSLSHVRVNFYGGKIGTKAAMVWSPDATQYWPWDTKELSIFDDKEYTEKVLFFVRRYDPRQAISYLQERASHGGVRVEIGLRAGNADPIMVTVDYDPNTYILDRPKPRMRELFSVDPATKLIARVQVQTLRGDRFADDGIYEYVDYNHPFDAKIFDLRQEVPADVNVSDTTGIPMGLAQGQLADEEIAVKVVREFLEAWVAKDYNRATQIYGYAAQGEAKSIREKLLRPKNIVRVISVGPPAAPEPPLTGLLVPCEVEYEENGQIKSERLEFRAGVGSPGRWRIRRSPPAK